MARDLIVGLDLSTRAQAEAIVETLDGIVDFFKIGYQLFYGGDGLALGKALLASGLFDAGWYRARYPDVGLLGADPAAHFLAHGRLLERSPGPRFDSRFYLAHYTDVGQRNPLLHHADLPDPGISEMAGWAKKRRGRNRARSR